MFIFHSDKEQSNNNKKDKSLSISKPPSAVTLNLIFLRMLILASKAAPMEIRRQGLVSFLHKQISSDNSRCNFVSQGPRIVQ